MAQREELNRVELARLEVESAVLGDQRLEARLERIVEALARQPGQSLPKAMGSDEALEATYRFLGNERVSSEAILAPHGARTVQRCGPHERVLALFDTSELSFGGKREELGQLKGDKGRGLLAHVGLAVSADGKRTPLGVLHLETVVRRGPPRSSTAKSSQSEPESRRWGRGAASVHALLPKAICVMDREADIFELIEQMTDREQDFVVRAAQNRNTTQGLLWDALDTAEVVATRAVQVSSRPQRKGARGRPARSTRTALLQVRVTTVLLRSPNSARNANTLERSSCLRVGLVHVLEPDPPSGEEPIEWVLLTSLPTNTATEVDFVIDSYRARWVIEELFKALKSGCALEKRQLESVRSITNVLAVSLPIAWLLLALRSCSRDQPDRPARTLLPPLMLQALRLLYLQRTKKALPDDPTVKDVTWAIAALGGHIKNNGEPGFLVLGRGMADLIQAVDLLALVGETQNVINP
jgi:hypothetical protein